MRLAPCWQTPWDSQFPHEPQVQVLLEQVRRSTPHNPHGRVSVAPALHSPSLMQPLSGPHWQLAMQTWIFCPHFVPHLVTFWFGGWHTPEVGPSQLLQVQVAEQVLFPLPQEDWHGSSAPGAQTPSLRQAVQPPHSQEAPQVRERTPQLPQASVCTSLGLHSPAAGPWQDPQLHWLLQVRSPAPQTV